MCIGRQIPDEKDEQPNKNNRIHKQHLSQHGSQFHSTRHKSIFVHSKLFDFKMNSIIVLNNNAVRCLQTGNFYDACKLMTEATNIMFEHTHGVHSLRRKKHRDCTITWTKIRKYGRDYTNDTKRDESPTIYPFAPTLIKPCCCSKKSMCFENHGCSQCHDDSDICPSNIAPIIWYNLGLCCQMLGSDIGQHTKEGHFYFNQATQLYQRVYNSCSSETPSHGLSTMKMAVLNNQGAMYFEMGEQEACSHVMKNLSDILSSISQSFMCRRWNVFYLNLMVFEAEPRPAAAA